MEPGYTRLKLDQDQPIVLTVQDPASLPSALDSLNLAIGRPTLVIVGGASKLSKDDYQRVRSLFTEILAPLAEQWGLSVVDGGTDAGIMQMIGQTRTAQHCTFPLIGAAPVGLVDLPSLPSAHPDAANLELNHTHCLLIPGSEWGDESPWIAEIADQLCQDSPTVAVLINGGEVTWKDAYCNVEAGRHVVVIEGSGRTADILAAALKGETVADERATGLVSSGRMHTVNLSNAKEELTQLLRKMLQP